MALEIVSSARVTSPWVRCLIFGLPDQGKSMCGVTAPNPVWLNTEPTCSGSLSVDIIEGAFGKGTPGITYDMPRLDIQDFAHLKEALTIIKAEGFETAVIDSGTRLSSLLLDHFKTKGGKGGTPLRDPRQAYGRAAEQTMEFFVDLFKLPMHIVITAHAAEKAVNKGSEAEPVWVPYLVPSFEGKVLGREIPHMIREIYRAKRVGLDDQGKPKFMLQTRKETEDGYERTLCTRLENEESPNLTNLFNKILGKTPTTKK